MRYTFSNENLQNWSLQLENDEKIEKNQEKTGITVAVYHFQYNLQQVSTLAPGNAPPKN